MTNLSEIPNWLHPVKLENFPVWRVNNNIMQCRHGLPRSWGSEPKLEENELEIEQVFQGLEPTDLLVLNFMENATPQGNLQDWLELIFKITGFPILPVTQLAMKTPELIQWQSLQIHDSLSEHFQVDEIFLYQGLAKLNGTPHLLHLYTILARRATYAWKIGLTLTSMDSSILGDREENGMIEDEKAGAILGELSFLSPS